MNKFPLNVIRTRQWENAGERARGNAQFHPGKRYLDRVSASLHTNARQPRVEPAQCALRESRVPENIDEIYSSLKWNIPPVFRETVPNISDISRRHGDFYRGGIYSCGTVAQSVILSWIFYPYRRGSRYVSRQSKKRIRTRAARIRRVRSVNNAEPDRSGSHKRVRRRLISSSLHFEHRKSDKPAVSAIWNLDYRMFR